jgi:hypothetical protein
VNPRYFALQLCTCTWIEIMTGAGFSLYLLYLQNFYLSTLTIALFAPLIGFHFAIDKLSRDKADWGQKRLLKIGSKRELVD